MPYLFYIFISIFINYNITIINKILLLIYVTVDHKTSHKGHFFEIEIYASSES